MYPSPLAVRSVVVIITLISVVDDPPDIITTTSTNPDNSEPVYSSDSNATTNTTQNNAKCITDSIKCCEHSLVVSMITPTALFTSTVIAGPSDDGTINIKSNVLFFPSANLSSITGTLTLLIVIPLSNVAVSVVVLKSTPPVSQTLFSQHIIIHITLLPLADTDDCSDGITVTLNGLLDDPPTSSNVTIINPVASELVYCVCVNFTLISVNNM